jgi:hypothetical protein
MRTADDQSIGCGTLLGLDQGDDFINIVIKSSCIEPKKLGGQLTLKVRCS